MWNQFLNQHITSLEIERSHWEVYHWAHAESLPTNVAHRHTFFEACLVGSHGTGLFRNEGELHPLSPHTFFLARPGSLHQIINTGAQDMELYWVCFALPHVDHGQAGSLLRAFETSPLVIADAQDALSAIWQALRAVAQESARGQGRQQNDILTMRCLAQALLLHIAQIGADATTRDEMLETSSLTSRLAHLGAQYVHDNMDRPLTPPEIARHLSVSRRQLTRLFSTHTGLPPRLYIERSRLDRARSLLRAGHKSIKEIAAATGYQDVHHFTRAFKRVVGVSPAQYRIAGAPLEAQSGPHIQKPGSLV